MYYLLYVFSKNKYPIKKYDNLLNIVRWLSCTLSRVMLKMSPLNVTHQFTRKPAVAPILLPLKALLYPACHGVRIPPVPWSQLPPSIYSQRILPREASFSTSYLKGFIFEVLL